MEFDGWPHIILSHIVSFLQHWLWSPPSFLPIFCRGHGSFISFVMLIQLKQIKQDYWRKSFPPSHCFWWLLFFFSEASKVPEFDERCLETFEGIFLSIFSTFVNMKNEFQSETFRLSMNHRCRQLTTIKFMTHRLRLQTISHIIVQLKWFIESIFFMNEYEQKPWMQSINSIKSRKKKTRESFLLIVSNVSITKRVWNHWPAFKLFWFSLSSGTSIESSTDTKI